ncbi:MAG: YcaO-like family protein, partial [Angustibacter sp.]
VDLSKVPSVAAAVAEMPADVRVSLVSVPNPFAVPVIGALVEDPRRGIVTLGTACRREVGEAGLKALGEALQLHVFSQGLLSPNGSVFRSMESGTLHARACKPFRPDRRYIDSYRADLRDATDLAANLQLYLDPRSRAWVERIVGAQASLPPPSSVVSSEIDLRADYLARIAAAGLSAVSVDVTTSDVAASGMHVVRVLVPGLLPNGPTGLPFLGGRRLTRYLLLSVG